MAITLSVIVVTYNPDQILTDCLNSLAAELDQTDTEIIVVDNASNRDISELIPKSLVNFRLIKNEINRGFAAANNQGLEIAGGKYALLINPDVIVIPTALTIMLRFLNEQPTIGILGPRTLNRDNSVALTAYPSYTPLMLLWQYMGLDRIFPYHVYGEYRFACETSNVPFSPAWIQASCMMLRHELYKEIGGLDEGLFLYAEEPDFCDRARAVGWDVNYCPMASVYHFESTTVSRYPLVKMRHYHLSPLHYFRKRGRGNAVLALKVGFSLELIIKLLLRLLEMRWLRDAASKARVKAYPVVLGEIWRY